MKDVFQCKFEINLVTNPSTKREILSEVLQFLLKKIYELLNENSFDTSKESNFMTLLTKVVESLPKAKTFYKMTFLRRIERIEKRK